MNIFFLTSLKEDTKIQIKVMRKRMSFQKKTTIFVIFNFSLYLKWSLKQV